MKVDWSTLDQLKENIHKRVFSTVVCFLCVDCVVTSVAFLGTIPMDIKPEDKLIEFCKAF